jgi:hypothetical protein
MIIIFMACYVIIHLISAISNCHQIEEKHLSQNNYKILGLIQHSLVVIFIWCILCLILQFTVPK